MRPAKILRRRSKTPVAKGLFKASDYVVQGASAEQDLAQAFKQDDLVVVVDDDHVFGSEEGPPKFYVRSLPGQKEDYLKFLGPQLEPLKNKVALAAIKHHRLLGRVMRDGLSADRKTIRISRFKYDTVTEQLKDKETYSAL